MGGRGSSSGAGGGAAKILGTSAKKLTAGLTKSMLDKFSRSQLETLGTVLAAKNMMKTMKISASEALRRAELLAPLTLMRKSRKPFGNLGILINLANNCKKEGTPSFFAFQAF